MTGSPISFVQVTDCHLFATEDGKLLGMNTQHSLDAVLDRIKREQAEFDFLLCTGDLSQDGSVSSYRRLWQTLNDEFGKDQYWIPGNHDDRPNMLQVVTEEQEMKPVIDLGDWQIVQLDSQVPGSVHGRLAESQLAIYEQALLQHPEKHTLVCMHHHPLPMHCEWLDPQQIKNSQALLDIVDDHRNAKVVLWGHVHQETHQTINETQYISTPSTCVQFTPKSEDFDVDKEGPGYRWMKLYPDGHIESGVSRVDDIEFEIDYTVKGY